MKLIASLSLALLIFGCGGGGGGGGGSNSSTQAPSLLASNAIPTIQDVIAYPVIGNYDYSTFQITFGHLGSSTANCFVVQTDTRYNSKSSPSIPDAPFYVVCQQSDGNFKEVSLQLFGQQYFVNGSQPLIADFNNDGIDDIILVDSYDGSYNSPYIYTFMSSGINAYQVNKIANGGWSPILVSNTVAVDINQDGCKDVVTFAGLVMLGNCRGYFVQTHITGTSTVENSSTNFMFGTAYCQGDFNNTGNPQLLITDSWVANYSPPNNIVEINGDLSVKAVHPLPIPFFTNRDGRADGSHNFQCRVGDINNDGKLDIIIFTSNFYQTTNGATPEFYIQTYINQGNWVFQDTSAVSIPGNSNLNLGDSYSPRLIDLNGDGYLDLAFDSPQWTSNNNLGNQVFINNKDGTFHSVFTTELNTISDAYRKQLGAIAGQPYLTMLPIVNGSKWDYILGAEDVAGHLHIGVANTQYVFK
jgi:hypothetical protein